MTCPNCDHSFEGDRCPNCGRLAKGASRGAAWIVFAFLVLPSAAVGTCSLVMGLPELGTPSAQGEGLIVLWFCIFVSLSMFAGSVAYFLSLWRK